MLRPSLTEQARRPERSSSIERADLISWYRRNRERSRALFDLLTDENARYGEPIPLRHPIVFYEGHVPAFSFNTLVKTALGGASIDPELESLFARGIDPPTDQEPARDPGSNRERWPGRTVVDRFAREADERVIDALTHADIDRPGHPLLDRSEAVLVILEHEAMHQETLHYMLHRLPWDQKRCPSGYRPRIGDASPSREWIEIPPGRATMGVDRASVSFAWDNECPRYSEEVRAFAIERGNVTNAAFLDFVAAGGYQERRFWRPDDWNWVRQADLRHPLFWERRSEGWTWRGMFEPIPLPLAWPVYVSHAEAEAYARWRGVRLPTEAEFQRAAYGTPEGDERPFPWGEAPADPRHGVFDFTGWDPAPTGSHPDGRSAWGVDDLVGNGWEWTSTPFAPFPGFRAMAAYPEYSADFFDGDHFVMKGASSATARELLRPSFRNWFRARYPYVYAKFRCVRDLA
ncbi:MAG TPA: SUMF1/EgtB/PvdO family nonheme iron enzyme [Candidatus Dormibacteraeota bacterium]|nr:SUMF1/EgtB/PvdO family nonheme iron enzyme [Candidatus Dormibacteraeota bacterium]